MKTLRLFLLALVATFAAAGCGTLDRSGPYQGDETLYRADLTITTSYQVLHSFVKWEYENRTLLAERPEVKRAADKIRLHAQTWVGSAIALREAYAANPDPAARKSLSTALAVLQAAMIEATTYLALQPPA